MKISFANGDYTFRWWKPSMGRVFSKTFAFDCETTLIDENRPWLTPTYVLGAACNGKQGYFVQRQHLAEFFRLHDGVAVAFHHAAFDLAVINLAIKDDLDIYDRVDAGQIWDTMLQHKLVMLGTEGHTACRKGESTLETCIKKHLAIELPKDTVDSAGNVVRLSYGKLLTRRLNSIEPVYFEYLARDVIATYKLYRHLRSRTKAMLAASDKTWGFVSPDWLADQRKKWGPSTHHIQLKASIVLAAITANGLHLDTERAADHLHEINEFLEERRSVLGEDGYHPGEKGCNTTLQRILGRLEREIPGLRFPRTPKNMITTKKDVLRELASDIPFVATLLEFRVTDKLRQFFEKMQVDQVHPRFDPLKVSGRTSSFGQINSQNLPRDNRVRSCFVPKRGHTFIVADYKFIELVTMAQAHIGQFGWESRLAEIINSGQDPHRLLAAIVARKPVEEVTREERQKAKAPGFGLPGGMGRDTLRRYAKASYGVELSEAEADAFIAAYYQLLPEMTLFLAHNDDIGYGVAKMLSLTPYTYFKHTGRDFFLLDPKNAGREYEPHPGIGGMCLKTMRDQNPVTGEGRPYSTAEIDFFWTQVASRIELFPRKYHADIQARRSSSLLRWAILRPVDEAAVFTLTGRLRAKASFTARHNCIFQGLAADGAKLGLWALWRAGFRIANFVHDEIVAEVPIADNYKKVAKTISKLMIAGMKEVVPDVTVGVEVAATTRWSKNAEAVYDKQRRLIAWSPKQSVPITTSNRKEQKPGAPRDGYNFRSAMRMRDGYKM